MAVLNDQVADELAVRDLVARFSDAVTRRAPADMAALWVQDGTWVVPGIGETMGPAAIEGVLAKLLEGFPFLVQLTHNGVVTLDGEVARARWYISEFGQDREGGGVYFVGTYHDRAVRTDAGWRFARRQFDFLYRGRTEAPGKSYPFPLLPEEAAWPA